MSTRVTLAVLVVGLGLALAPGAAQASPPVGTCPGTYTTLTRHQASKLPDADLALAAFDVVDANHDGLVCYREYPNAPHHTGHYGNFVDDTAAPHQ